MPIRTEDTITLAIDDSNRHERNESATGAAFCDEKITAGVKRTNVRISLAIRALRVPYLGRMYNSTAGRIHAVRILNGAATR
jgi:hypothetical protein